MSDSVCSPKSTAHYGADQVVAAIEHHARLNRRPVSILSTEFSEDGSRVWSVTFADESRMVTQDWIEDPRPTDVTLADIFHDGVRLGLKA
jgi:hypothetical protein